MQRKDIFKQIIAEFHQDTLPNVLDRALRIPINTVTFTT